MSLLRVATTTVCAVLACALLGSCRGIAIIVVRPDATISDDASSDSGDVDSGIACSTDNVYEPGEIACCGGAFCRGNCADSGSCDCGGIAGGCHQGSVCCHGVCTGYYACLENITDGTETCDASTQNPLGVCCGGEPRFDCNGVCHRYRDGGPVCDCWGIIGGCPPGQCCFMGGTSTSRGRFPGCWLDCTG